MKSIVVTHDSVQFVFLILIIPILTLQLLTLVKVHPSMNHAIRRYFQASPKCVLCAGEIMIAVRVWYDLKPSGAVLSGELLVPQIFLMFTLEGMLHWMKKFNMRSV